MRRWFGYGSLALIFVGCALTPDYERPPLNLPETWVEPIDAGESIANLPWWELYEDEKLRGLIEIALVENKDLAIAFARIKESEYQVTFVRADQFPFLGVGGSVGRGRPSRIAVPGASTSSQFALGASLTFEVDLWHKFSRATEAARAELLGTEAAYRTVMITLVASVASTYFLLRDFDDRLAISERTVVSRRDSLKIIQARFDKGTVPELDVNQAQIELAIAEAAVADFQRRTAQAQNALRILLGRYPGPIERGLELADQPIPPEIPPGLTSDLLRRRPDIAAAEQKLITETARVGVAEAFRYPSISLTGSVGVIAEDLTDFNTSEAKAWNILADIFQPIFNSGQLKAQARSQAARAEQALHAFIATVQQAMREVEDSLVAVRTLRIEHAARARQVVAARNAARLSRARYDGGVVDYLEVLDSERSLFGSELDESATRQASLTAVVRLYKALGGGWIMPPEPAP